MEAMLKEPLAHTNEQETKSLADHPYFFLIRHISTESILFLGRVVDPRMFEPES